MQPGQPGRTLRVHWSDAGVTAVLWRSDATATWEPLVMQPASNAERGYLLPGQTSHVRLERSGGKAPLELTSTVPSTPAC
jgi:hypothetical protein